MKKSSGLVLLKSGTGIRMWVIITGSAVNLCHTRTNGQTYNIKNISTTKNDPIFFSLGSDNLLLYREAFVNNFSHGRVSLQ